MKTAIEHIQELFSINDETKSLTYVEIWEKIEDHLSDHMKEYAKEVSEKTLKDAGVKVAKFYKKSGFTNTGILAQREILTTKIELP